MIVQAFCIVDDRHPLVFALLLRSLRKFFSWCDKEPRESADIPTKRLANEISQERIKFWRVCSQLALMSSFLTLFRRGWQFGALLDTRIPCQIQTRWTRGESIFLSRTLRVLPWFVWKSFGYDTQTDQVARMTNRLIYNLCHILAGQKQNCL